MARKGTQGLTLVEVLVVIGILTVLFAIILSVYMPAKNRAKSVGCINNLKQLFLAEQLYREDWHKFGLWHQLLRGGTLSAKEVLICPMEFRKDYPSAWLPHSYACHIPLDKDSWQCFYKRGPDYPLIFCGVHEIDRAARAEGRRPYWRVIRMSGGVDEVDVHNFLDWHVLASVRGELPCPGQGFGGNF